MAGLEADTSSYNQPLPVSPLKTVQEIGALKQQQQQIESGGLQIDRQKLELANQGLSYMTRAMGSLGPDASKEDYLAVGQNAVKMGLVKPEMLSTYQQRLIAAKSPQDFYNEFMTAAASHEQAINYHLGTRQDVSNGQTVTPAVTSVKPGFGVRPISAPIQQQLPVGTEGVITDRNDPNFGAKKAIGPQPTQIPEGAVPAGKLPGQYAMPVAAPKPKVSGATGPTVETTHNVPTTFENRFAAARPSGVQTSLPPGTSESMSTTAQGGAVGAVKARERAGSYQREIFPLQQAIPALEKLGTKGTGPGTETIQHLKSFALSNLPGVKESDFNGTVADYDKAKKYLTDFVNQTGNSGTNDKLAAAFAGNPSVGISNAAAVDVAKSALALRRMQQAEVVAFEKSGLPEQDYQKFSVRFNNEQDPRAYGFDQMSPVNRKKLIEGMTPEELAVFKTSLEFAHSSKILPPIGKR